MKISECMSKDVCFVKPECNAYDAARIMCENHIGCIPVCNEQKSVVGIITDRDILLRTVACNKETKKTPVSEIMTTNVYTCNLEKEITEAQNLMAQNQIRRIPVVDNEKKIVGILTMGDLAKNDKKIGQQNVSTTIENICNCQGSIKNCG